MRTRYGSDVGLQMIVETVFDMAHEYPEHMTSAWLQIADLIIRMGQIGLIEISQDFGQVTTPLRVTRAPGGCCFMVASFSLSRRRMCCPLAELAGTDLSRTWHTAIRKKEMASPGHPHCDCVGRIV